ncbi:MAG: sigma 54-interacting transcriptional regulator [bacterium]
MKNGTEREIFEIIFNSINEGVFSTDRDCRVTSFNTAAEKISGFKKEEVIGQYCFDIFRTDLCQSQCALRTTIQQGKPIDNVRVNILTRDGRSVPINVSTTVLVNEDGEVFGALEFFRDLSEIEELRKQLSGSFKFNDLVSSNAEMKELFNLLPEVAQSECNVLIQGPSGSGKELFAKALHTLSSRKNGQYIKVNCAALPDNLLESELFGYVKGAFTDARRDKPGRFELAKGGTILLDEIGDMSIALQSKLLRVVQEGEVQPLGSTKTLYTDARIIASTNRDLRKMVAEGGFREDLFYRLNVITINIPPLSRRREDIPLLIDHFMNRQRLMSGKDIRRMSPEAVEILMRYGYPGNVRELENAIEHAFVLCKRDVISVEHLPRGIVDFSPSRETGSGEPGYNPLMLAEAGEIQRTLKKHNGNRLRAAKELGLHRTTLWRKMKRYGIAVSKGG